MRRLAVFTAKLIPKLLAFILVAGIHLSVHECGHYAAARALDVEVEELHVGSGPVLYRGELSDGAELQISLYPTRGHVLHMGGLLSTADRSAIAAAGMVATVMLVFLLYAIMFIAIPSGIPWHRSIWSAFRLSVLEWLLFPFRLMWYFMSLRPFRMLERAWAVILFLLGKDFRLGNTVVSGPTLVLLACVNMMALLAGLSILPSLDFGSDCDELGSLLMFSCMGVRGLGVWVYLVLFFYVSIWISVILFALTLPFRVYRHYVRTRQELEELVDEDPEAEESEDEKS